MVPALTIGREKPRPEGEEEEFGCEYDEGPVDERSGFIVFLKRIAGVVAVAILVLVAGVLYFVFR